MKRIFAGRRVLPWVTLPLLGLFVALGGPSYASELTTSSSTSSQATAAQATTPTTPGPTTTTTPTDGIHSAHGWIERLVYVSAQKEFKDFEGQNSPVIVVHAKCPESGDWKVIGGGARVEVEGGRGASVIDSTPLEGEDGWVARARQDTGRDAADVEGKPFRVTAICAQAFSDRSE